MARSAVAGGDGIEPPTSPELADTADEIGPQIAIAAEANPGTLRGTTRPETSRQESAMIERQGMSVSSREPDVAF
jgi:hypothetical protein